MRWACPPTPAAVERAKQASRAMQDSIAEGEDGEVEVEFAGDMARFRMGFRAGRNYLQTGGRPASSCTACAS